MEEMIVQCNLVDRVMWVNERIQLVQFDTESCLSAIRTFAKQHESLNAPYITYNPSPSFYVERTRGALKYTQVNTSDLMDGCRFVSYNEDAREATIAFDKPGALNAVKIMMPAKKPTLIIRTTGNIEPVVVDDVTGEKKLYYMIDRFISIDLVMIEHKEEDTDGSDNKNSGGDSGGDTDGSGEVPGNVSEGEGGLGLSEEH